ncbi:tyrosine-type recombinase/integrase [Streptomyces microflavus]|uniref:tyrosine-type recombinase/integrase n=1 Tax=Streptomyces microflavus TaxID=1919 RepID=UPI0037FD29DD
MSECAAVGTPWTDERLVFPNADGTLRSAINVRRSFRAHLSKAGFTEPHRWTPREIRTSFVSLLSDQGIPIAVIARVVCHSGTNVTEKVYRK